MDITIVLLPAFPVAKMQLPTGQKYAVIGLFACGIMYDPFHSLGFLFFFFLLTNMPG